MKWIDSEPVFDSMGTLIAALAGVILGGLAVYAAGILL
ncbi:hypothetical protein ASZ90_009745 [hydrocarbon metagenome]|uniref:Uncharacterized protein n=1 Tax=hydrocarbon metagenome TaxID=938273 RepID=A0A0W8FI12_9ZZZZ